MSTDVIAEIPRDRYEVRAKRVDGSDVPLGWSDESDGGHVMTFARTSAAYGGPWFSFYIVDLWPKEL